MASGHVNRTNRPNTRLHRPICYVKKALANSEPSTHGALQTQILKAKSRWAMGRHWPLSRVSEPAVAS
jgi:hypothetical protein